VTGSTRSPGEWLLLTALITIVAILALAPLGQLLLESVAPGGQWSTRVLAEVLNDPLTWRATVRSLVTALGGTLIAVVLGSAFALLVALTDLRGKPLLVFGFLLPLMSPPQVTALAWTQLFGPSSVLLRTLGLAPPLGSPNPLYSPQGIILLLGVQHGPLVFLALRAGLRSLPRELVEGARAAGARPWQVLHTVVLPLMTLPLVAGTTLAVAGGGSVLAAHRCGAGFGKRLRSVVLPPVVPLLGAGAILVFLTAVNELTVSALLWSSGSETLGVVIFNLDDGGYTVLATAVAVLTVLMILVLMLLGSWLGRYLPRGVLPWEV